MKVLVIEDDADTADFICRGLREVGCLADHAATGVDGLFLASDGSHSVLVVDRMLPGIDGLKLVRMLRETGVHTPVLFLTAVAGLRDRVEGLEAGGGDYLVKPFAFSELLARLRVLARRRYAETTPTELRVADLKLDRLTRQATRAGQAIDLQPREFRLLEYLMENAGRVVTRTMLLEQVWEFHFEPRTSVVETHVSRLRAKVDRPFETPLIHTVRGSGYIIDDPA